MSGTESFQRQARCLWPRWGARAFWGLAAIVLINLHWLHLWGMPRVQSIGLGVMLICCLIPLGLTFAQWRRVPGRRHSFLNQLFGLTGARWREMPGTPGRLLCATIASWLFIGVAALLVADAALWPVAGEDLLRQGFFILVLLAALLGGRMVLARDGAESLLNGVLAILVASCLIVVATPLLRYWDVLLTFRLPFRLNGSFTDPNDAGFIGCMTVALALALLAHGRRGRLGYLGLAVGAAAALASFSRSAILVVCGILVLLPLCNGGRRMRLFLFGSLASGLIGLSVYGAVTSGLWPLRDLAFGRDLERFDLCLPLPQTSEGLLADCEILLAARDTLAGDAPLNWSRVAPIDIWQGITVDGPQGRVTELSLPGMRLNGRIPPQLGGLEQLVTLRLSNNRLTGSVPSELDNLSNLQNLWLAVNNLTGALPPGLAALVRASPGLGARARPRADRPGVLRPAPGPGMDGEQPGSFRQAPAELDAVVSGNDLFCRPGQVDTSLLADCEILLAVRDALAGDAILNWSEDVPIGLWDGVTLNDMSSVRVGALVLPGLGLNGRIPPQLGDLDQLVVLVQAANRLTGAIPPELGRLANLQVLSLGANDLTGIVPPELGKLAKLNDLWLAENRLTGSVPPELEGFGAQAFGLVIVKPSRSSLTPAEHAGFYFGDDVFCRPGQADASLLADCEILLMVRDALAGDAILNWSEDIPIGLWDGVTLSDIPPVRVTGLSLPGAYLNGRISPQLGGLDQLVTLRLANNRLTGPIPSELGKLVNLEILSLSRNGLTGAVPPELGRLARLRGLWLARNSLTGTIPPPLLGIAHHDLVHSIFCLPGYPHTTPGLLADCDRLLAGKDTLAGDMPLNWGNYVPIGFWQGVAVSGDDTGAGRVVRVDLSEQELNGRIPPEFGGLEQLVTLRLSRNRLTGAVPPELGSLVKLRTLALESNTLTGPLPLELIRDDLALHLAGNNFGLLTAIQTSRRLAMWRASLEDALESPFIGSGLGKFRSIAGNLSNAQGASEGVHNLYLRLFGEAGVAPLALYCLFLLSLLRLRWTAPSSPARDAAVGWAVVMALFSVTYHHLLTLGAFLFLAGLSCALAAHAVAAEPSRRGQRRPDVRLQAFIKGSTIS